MQEKKRIVYRGPLKTVSLAPDGYSEQGRGPAVHRGKPTEVLAEVADRLVNDGPWELAPPEVDTGRRKVFPEDRKRMAAESQKSAPAKQAKGKAKTSTKGD